MIAAIALPGILRIGGGAFAETRAVLESLGLSRPLIVTDPMMVKFGLAERLQGLLGGAAVFSDTVPEPDTDAVVKEYKETHEGWL